jgi:hypothetical protein
MCESLRDKCRKSRACREEGIKIPESVAGWSTVYLLPPLSLALSKERDPCVAALVLLYCSGGKSEIRNNGTCEKPRNFSKAKSRGSKNTSSGTYLKASYLIKIARKKS